MVENKRKLHCGVPMVCIVFVVFWETASQRVKCTEIMLYPHHLSLSVFQLL